MVDDEDYGFLYHWRWHYSGNGYAMGSIYVPGTQESFHFTMHRMIMNTPAGYDTDHINGNKLDNRRKNLRIVTRSQNMANLRPTRANKSGLKGASFHKETKKWVARIGWKGRTLYIGLYETPQEAHEAYCKKATELYGEYARFS